MKNPQTARDLFSNARTIWIEGARVVARKLLRKKRFITIEDILALHPRPKYIHRNTTGQIFKSNKFRAIGYTRAKKPSSHGRVIRMWELKDYE